MVASNCTREGNGGVRGRISRGTQQTKEKWTDLRAHVNFQRHTPQRAHDQSPGVGVWEGDLRNKLRQKRARGGLEGHTRQHHHTDKMVHRKQNRSHYQWRERDEGQWAQGYDGHHAVQPAGFDPYHGHRKWPRYDRDGESMDRSAWRGEQYVSSTHYQPPLRDHAHHHRQPPHVDSVDTWMGGHGYDPGYQEQQGFSLEWSRRRKGRGEHRF